MVYKVYDYEELLTTEMSLADAVTYAEAALKGLLSRPGHRNAHYAYVIANETGKLVASVTNLRITGVFTKQNWGGRKGNDPIHAGEEEFDATDYVLNMPYDEVLEIRDNRESSDAIGTAHIQWNGPYEVDIVDSICEFFGVGQLDDITPEMFEFVRGRYKPRTPEAHEIEMTLKVRVTVSPGATLGDFIRDAEYSVKSATSGVLVTSVTMAGRTQSGEA
jgi:hypothetical protein